MALLVLLRLCQHAACGPIPAYEVTLVTTLWVCAHSWAQQESAEVNHK